MSRRAEMKISAHGAHAGYTNAETVEKPCRGCRKR